MRKNILILSHNEAEYSRWISSLSGEQRHFVHIAWDTKVFKECITPQHMSHQLKSTSWDYVVITSVFESTEVEARELLELLYHACPNCKTFLATSDTKLISSLKDFVHVTVDADNLPNALRKNIRNRKVKKIA